MEDCEGPPEPKATAGQIAERIAEVLWKLEEAGREAKVHLENCLALSDRMGLLKPAMEELRESAQAMELKSPVPRDPALEVLLLRLERSALRFLPLLPMARLCSRAFRLPCPPDRPSEKLVLCNVLVPCKRTFSFCCCLAEL